ncbi:DUF190 domain-containing protein [Kouleothrix sp.]|uniref:DUF190 domain-containing protein n=1 Tax=Kouleothrix sp. TaxID=2779161 RepID=UPI00391AB7F3
MSHSEIVKRVRVYLNERDMAEGQPLYQAALDQLSRAGATGATALRGVAGFGAGQRLRATGAGDTATAPIVIEWIDRADRVGRILPQLDELLRDALITIEDVRVYRAVLRSSGPFGDRTVGQMMRAQPAAGHPTMPARAAAELMLAREQPLLPVLDERGALVGTLGAADLALRGGLALPLGLLPALSAAERQALLDQMPARTLAEVMASDPRTVYADLPAAQALSPMVEWGLDTLPVLDHDGRLVGLFGLEQALRAVVRRPEAASAAVRDAEPPTPVGLVMQRSVASLPAAAPLAAVLALLNSSADRFVVVLEDGKPLGTIADALLARRLAEPARSAWLDALRAPDLPLGALPDAPGAAALLADRTMPRIGQQAPIDEAIGLMLEGNHERLLVLDDERLVGVLTRPGLLRALAQSLG